MSDPIVMEVSAFSNIHQKLRYLATALRNQGEADTSLVYIECFTHTDETNGKDLSVIRFRSSLEMWCEINPVKKYGGSILGQNVAVNLYDLYNMVENCKDELISFWIDDETNELVVSSFYNETLDADELEIRLPIRDKDFPTSDFGTDSEPDFSVALSSMVTWSAVKELNVEKKADSISFIFDEGNLSLATDYHGTMVLIRHKELKNVDYGDKCRSFSIPFNIFHLMTSTGQVKDIEIKVYPKFVILDTDEYSFRYCFIDNVWLETSAFDIKTKPIFIISADDGMASIEKINQINSHAKSIEITYEKVQDGTADFGAEFEGRMKTFVRIGCATLSDTSVKFDGYLFKSLFTDTGVDAIAVTQGADGRLVMDYENSLLIKTVVYDHVKFMEYRKSDV